jgi:hypothetical protein
VNFSWTASLIAQVSWSKTLTRPSDDSCRSICPDARRRTSFHLDSAPASRCADSECTAAYCGRITCKQRSLAPGTFAGGSLHGVPPGGWILVPSRTAGLVKESSVLPSEEQLEKPCTESHLAPFGCRPCYSQSSLLARMWFRYWLVKQGYLQHGFSFTTA